MLLRSTTASISRSASGFVRPTAAVPDSAPEPAPDRFRLSASALAVLRVCFCFVVVASRSAVLLPCFMFGPSAPLRGTTMASADFWRCIPTPLDAGSTKANRQISPGIAHPPSRLCLSDLRHGVPCKYWALQYIGLLTPPCRLYPLPVRQASALPAASFRFHLAMDTLAVQLTLPLAGCVEDFHLQVSAPCRAHQSKGPLRNRGTAFDRCPEDSDYLTPTSEGRVSSFPLA